MLSPPLFAAAVYRSGERIRRNQPADVTGYNVYRADAPTGPWVLLGSNVVDMDSGTPDIQYVDQTGNVGGPWFYEVAAWNETCGAEGPY